MGRGIKSIRPMLHFDSNKPLGQGRAGNTGGIPALPTREHEQVFPFREDCTPATDKCLLRAQCGDLFCVTGGSKSLGSATDTNVTRKRMP